jgi:hypothetical protein
MMVCARSKTMTQRSRRNDEAFVVGLEQRDRPGNLLDKPGEPSHLSDVPHISR